MDTFLGLLFIILWASAAPAAKVGIRDAEPLTLLDARFFLAGGLLLAYLYLIRRDTPMPKGRQWGQLAVLAFTNSAGYLGLSWYSFKLVPAGLFGLFIAINPLIVALLSRLVLKRQISRNEWAGIGVAAMGLCVAALPRLQGKETTALGVGLVLTAMVIYSCGSIYYKWAKVTLAGPPLNAWQMVLGAGLLLPFAVWFNGNQVPQLTGGLITALSWSVLAVSIAANLLWFHLLKKDPLRANMWLFLNPIFGYLIAWLVLGESMNATDFAGLILVMAGLLLSGTINVRVAPTGECRCRGPRTCEINLMQQPTPSDIEQYLDAASIILGLPIPPEHKQNVILHFARTAAFAALVNAVDLPDGLESAAIFRLPDLDKQAEGKPDLP